MNYILSIVGVVFLGVMVDIISPEGKTNSFIKSMFAIFLMFVILTPVINFFSKSNINDILNSSYENDKDYISDIVDLRIEDLKSSVISELEKQGIFGTNVEIEGKMKEQKIEIEKVVVNAQNVVLTNADKHIDKYKVITEVIAEVLKIDSEVIEYEQ